MLIKAKCRCTSYKFCWIRFKEGYNTVRLMNSRKTTLDMFIPEDRRQALSRGETLPARSRGAVLFADVSGFTRLKGIFSNELGPQRGAEALNQLLDPLYIDVMDAIHNFIGSVIVIRGDMI